MQIGTLRTGVVGYPNEVAVWRGFAPFRVAIFYLRHNTVFSRVYGGTERPNRSAPARLAYAWRIQELQS